jgi:hypothetical protein
VASSRSRSPRRVFDVYARSPWLSTSVEEARIGAEKDLAAGLRVQRFAAMALQHNVITASEQSQSRPPANWPRQLPPSRTGKLAGPIPIAPTPANGGACRERET